MNAQTAIRLCRARFQPLRRNYIGKRFSLRHPLGPTCHKNSFSPGTLPRHNQLTKLAANSVRAPLLGKDIFPLHENVVQQG